MLLEKEIPRENLIKRKYINKEIQVSVMWYHLCFISEWIRGSLPKKLLLLWDRNMFLKKICNNNYVLILSGVWEWRKYELQRQGGMVWCVQAEMVLHTPTLREESGGWKTGSCFILGHLQWPCGELFNSATHLLSCEELNGIFSW